MQPEAKMKQGCLSGDIMPGVEKAAAIHFTTPEGKTVPDDNTITLYFGDVYNKGNYFVIKEFTAKINLE